MANIVHAATNIMCVVANIMCAVADLPIEGAKRDFLIYLKIFGIFNAENILLFKRC